MYGSGYLIETDDLIIYFDEDGDYNAAHKPRVLSGIISKKQSRKLKAGGRFYTLWYTHPDHSEQVISINEQVDTSARFHIGDQILLEPQTDGKVIDK